MVTEKQNGLDSLIVSRHTDGTLTLEMDITEACKSVSLPGTRFEMVNSRVIPIVQDQETRWLLRVEFSQGKAGVRGETVPTTPGMGVR
jgi:hypothetical protein